MAYIYTLSDPRTNAIRYIGKTINDPSIRLYGHIKKAKDVKNKYHSVTWIRSLLVLDMLPVVAVIRTVEVEYLNDTERFCIAEYKRLGCDLTNTTEGGDDSGYVYERTDEIRAALSQGVKAYWESLDDKAKIEHSEKLIKNAEAYRERLVKEGKPHHNVGHIPWNKGKKIGGDPVRQVWVERKKNGFISQAEMCQEIADAVNESRAKVERALKGRSNKVAKDVTEKVWNYYLENADSYPNLTVVYIDGSKPNTVRAYNRVQE